jgi:hypothetical protein
MFPFLITGRILTTARDSWKFVLIGGNPENYNHQPDSDSRELGW